MLAAVQQNVYALQFAAEELKKDREVVLAAVQQNGGALQYAAEELKKDREVVQLFEAQAAVALLLTSLRSCKSPGGFLGFDCSLVSFILELVQRASLCSATYPFVCILHLVVSLCCRVLSGSTESEEDVERR